MPFCLLSRQKDWEDDIAFFGAIRKIGQVKAYSPGYWGISLFASKDSMRTLC